jgi:hypothetical protein
MKGFVLVCAVAICAIALGGCASGFQSFYRPTATPAQVAEMRAGSPTETPELQHASFPADSAIEAAARRGYLVMGYASFNGAHGSDSSALAEGKRVGADLVLVFDPRYTGTRNGAVPITTPTSQTTYYNGTATAYGNGGSVTAYGSGMATTYGSRTTYIPFHVDRYDYLAIYLFKEQIHTGLLLRGLTDAQRQTISSNAGAYVYGVVDGSPAYLANVLAGDIVTQVDGRPFANTPEINAYVKAHRGYPVTFTIYRNGQYISKTFALLP